MCSPVTVILKNCRFCLASKNNIEFRLHKDALINRSTMNVITSVNVLLITTNSLPAVPLNFAEGFFFHLVVLFYCTFYARNTCTALSSSLQWKGPPTVGSKPPVHIQTADRHVVCMLLTLSQVRAKL